MGYEVTATRKRPQVFDALVGQGFVAQALKSSIESGKIAHAYLFSGPRGCGKTSTARILAKALNCDKGPTSAPCGECVHCREITAGSSLDVIEIDGASNTSVNDVRQIKDEVMFPPNSSRYKIYIIDEVHMLSTSAFNALLKTIEEPPPHVVFIFATTETQKVPATIKSRCQQFMFRLVAVDDVTSLLRDAAKEAGVTAEDEALVWIARQGAGSIRDAYTLFDQVTAFCDGHITYDKIRDKLGLVGIDRLNTIFAHCAAGNAQQALETVDEALQAGVGVEQLVLDAVSYVRSLLLIASGVTKDSLLGEARQRYSKEVMAAWGVEQGNSVIVERALSLLLQLYRDIRYTPAPRYEVELAISRLSWLKDYVSPRELKAALNAVRPLIGGAGWQVASGTAKPSSQEASSPVSGPEAGGSVNTPTGESVAACIANVPPGVPIFSALRGASDSGDENAGDSGPFDSGGAGEDNTPPAPPQSGVQGRRVAACSVQGRRVAERIEATDTQGDAPFDTLRYSRSLGSVQGRRVAERIEAADTQGDAPFDTLRYSRSLGSVQGRRVAERIEATDTEKPQGGAYKVNDKADASVADENDLPPAVRMLRDAFRGQVTVVKKS